MLSLSRLRSSLPFAPTTTPLQGLTYLLGISLFSISFLVFLNSSVSFVITDRLGEREGVGDVVGTLGFVDELVALVACPVWGLLSDRVGVRNVAVAGYAIIGLSLVLFVAAANVYPQLLLARMVFAAGASAAATMVTATLPSLTDDAATTDAEDDSDSSDTLNSRSRRYKPRHASRSSTADSLASDVTITPELFARSQPQQSEDGDGTCPYNPDAPRQSKPNALAGLVGLFTGCGALLALVLFLPLPARFGSIEGVTMAKAVEYSYYVVACASILVAVFVGFGLRGLNGEEGKGWGVLFKWKRNDTTSVVDDDDDDDHATRYNPLPYHRLLIASVVLGFKDSRIGLGYLGGFVARASTVAISLFIPLAVNSFYMNNGFCQGSPNDPSPELKKECRQAYILSSILTGVAQLMGLICAPVFGYFSSRSTGARINWPVLLAAVMGIAGYIAFAQLDSPEMKDVDGRGGGPGIFVVVALVGISQIGAIVCSLGSLGRGVLAVDINDAPLMGGRATENRGYNDNEQITEAAPLLRTASERAAAEEVNGHRRRSSGSELEASRVQLKGSIAGVYSWCGGAAILLLTKLGGYLFDSLGMGAPFYMMAVFNGVLFLATLAIDVTGLVRERRMLEQSPTRPISTE
ncbi:hypothetical protein MKZ38_010328 [Zalerion maritima]|uniref:MFS transporter n=1 Tax=Zalerion maritima TaxID=339359 RepID=A0AAD5RY48_9PEZI|nr:hypothetical protein MKZ38_010328 [Zalerion maritima]